VGVSRSVAGDVTKDPPATEGIEGAAGSFASEDSAAESSGSADASPQSQRLRDRLVPAVVRCVAAVTARLQTPAVLKAGTIATGVLALGTATLFVVIGIAGVGTHIGILPQEPPQVSDTGAENANPNFGPPIFFAPPTIVGPAAPQNPVLSDDLAMAVLKSRDLANEFNALDQGPIGGDASSGLIAAYHSVFQRTDAPPTSEFPGVLAVFSVVGRYRDEPTAAAQLTGSDLGRLGADAGLPNFTVEYVDVPQLGDQTRAVHLTGMTAGIDVGVYLIEFRRGTLNAVVGVASPLGSESLVQAMSIAQTEDVRLIAAALP
jgi:hypothetical protein